jgi:hypothetical protein
MRPVGFATMARDDIEWVREDAGGERIEVKAHQIRERWDFYWRPGRHYGWEKPAKVRRLIRQRFPKAELDDL